MPQPGQGPDNEGIADHLPPFSPVSAQGNVHIVPEKGAQGDMPPAPEFRNAAGYVGIVEVFRVMEPQHPAHADGHIGIGGKIQVNVQRIGQ